MHELSMFLLVALLALFQLAVAVGFVWLVVYFATKRRRVETEARLSDLETRMSRMERSYYEAPDLGQDE